MSAGKRSRDKGIRGELEIRDIVRERGFEAKRGGAQGDGGSADTPDVVHNIPGIHLEVKRTEALNFYAAFRQAQGDAGTREPVVVHRRSREDWMAYVRLDHYLDLQAELVLLRQQAEWTGL
jgi:hypothetical protein